ncbi:caspase family protein [Actinoplanes sp. NPDC051861]|uniref:caspase family protein n=1 Tax=Actinoplanes sp. NPDC051861 TaxID=3155170 RepID=UPI00342CD9C0
MSDRRLALVVAVDTYVDAALNRLAAPAADAAALSEVLGDPALGDFEVEVLHNATSWATAERVERMLAEVHPTDLVLLHFSCHGLKDESGELYLAAANTRPDLLGSTAVDAAWVSRLMQRSRAERVVLLLDCCYGGAFEQGMLARAGRTVDVGDQFRQRSLGGGRGRVVITASTAMEYSFEGTHLTGGGAAQPSIFTGALVEGIRTGGADRDGDGQVGLGELYDYVFDRVRERTPRQTPSKWEFGLRGDIYLAHAPDRAPAAPPPPEPAPAVPPPPEPPLPDPDPPATRMSARVKSLVAAGLVLLVAAVAIAFDWISIWSDDNGGGEQPPSAYTNLVNMLPEEMRATCSEGKPTAGNSARAYCTPGVYTVWNTKKGLESELRIVGSKKGDCAATPTTTRRIEDTITAGGRTARITCEVVAPGSSEHYYNIQLGLDDVLLTGRFLTGRGVGSAGYQEAYTQAREVLAGLP